MKYHPQHKIFYQKMNLDSTPLQIICQEEYLAIIIITDKSEGLFITDCTDTTFQYYLNISNHKLLV